MSADLLDQRRIEELRDELGEEDFAPIYEMFIDEARQIVDNIRTDSGESLLKNVHSLKGAARNVGFRGLALLCEEIERESEAAQQQVLIDRVQELFIRSTAEMGAAS